MVSLGEFMFFLPAAQLDRFHSTSQCDAMDGILGLKDIRNTPFHINEPLVAVVGGGGLVVVVVGCVCEWGGTFSIH